MTEQIIWYERGQEARAEAAWLRDKALAAANAPGPALLGVCIAGGRVGLRYATPAGEPMDTLLAHNPMSIRRCAHRLAALQAALRALPTPPGLPPLKAWLRAQIDIAQSTALLPPALAAHALRRLDALPEGNTLCLTGLHPSQIRISAAGDTVRSWANAHIGDPCADACLTSLRLSCTPPPPNTPPHLLRPHQSFAASLDRQYFAQYLRLTNQSQESIAQWQAPAAAAFLPECAPWAQASLLALLPKNSPQ